MAVVPVLLITGPIGAGKTTVASAISARLRDAQVPHALLDLDWITECCPAPADDPFHTALAMQNLAALWRNFRDAGATHLVLSWVVEARDELDAYRAAVPGAQITVVRLRAPVETLIRRIDQRNTDSDRAWSYHRTRQLAEIMDAARVEDLLIETEGRSVEAIVGEILDRVGWLDRTHRNM